MSVDLSTMVGVGFLIDPEVFKAFKNRVDPNDVLIDEELFYDNDGNSLLPDGIEFGQGGSYYDNSEFDSYFYVERLTERFGEYDGKQGFYPIAVNEELYSEEVLDLYDAAKLLSPKYIGIEITPFVAQLWH